MNTRGGPTALAIFVKTPGFSPLKTRLAAGIGSDAAETFHRLAAAAVAEVAAAAGVDVQPYWTVAEDAPEARRCWTGFAAIGQGAGPLGQRLHDVYDHLLRRHGRVLLIGADAPQITVELLHRAASALAGRTHDFVIGPADDGGFWLFGGRAPIAPERWCAVTYSRADTADQLLRQLGAPARVARLPPLRDADSAADLAPLARALDALPAPLPTQRALAGWLQQSRGYSAGPR